MQDLEAPLAVLSAWNLVNARLAPLGGGLINRTWRVTVPGADYVLQQVNPLFSPQATGIFRRSQPIYGPGGCCPRNCCPLPRAGCGLKTGAGCFGS